MDKSIFPYPVIENSETKASSRPIPAIPKSQLERHLKELTQALEAGNYDASPVSLIDSDALRREDFMAESPDDPTAPDEG